jgi:4-hydroxybenzoate polyprenyltransferase
MASYFKKLSMKPNYAFYSMLFGWGTSLIWMILGYINGNNGEYPFGIEPMYPGLLVSLLIWWLGRRN